MTKFKLIGAAALLSATIATPALAQQAVQGPGAQAFYQSLGVGSHNYYGAPSLRGGECAGIRRQRRSSRWRLRGIIGMSRSTGSERAVMARRSVRPSQQRREAACGPLFRAPMQEADWPIVTEAGSRRVDRQAGTPFRFSGCFSGVQTKKADGDEARAVGRRRRRVGGAGDAGDGPGGHAGTRHDRIQLSELAVFDRRIWRAHAIQHWPLSAHAVLPARILRARPLRGWRRHRQGRGDCSPPFVEDSYAYYAPY